MGDAHKVIVHHVGEVIGGQPVPLHEHLIVQCVVWHGDVAENLVVEGGLPRGNALADNKVLPRRGPSVGLLTGKLPAGVGSPVKLAGIGFRLGLFAKAAVGAALFQQELGVFSVKIPALRLDIGSHGAAHVGALVVVKTALGQGLVDNIHRPIHKSALIGVLDAKDEFAAGPAGDEPGIKRRAQIANVHIARGRRGKTGTHTVFGYARLHLVKPVFICHFVYFLSGNSLALLYYFTFCLLSRRY